MHRGLIDHFTRCAHLHTLTSSHYYLRLVDCLAGAADPFAIPILQSQEALYARRIPKHTGPYGFNYTSGCSRLPRKPTRCYKMHQANGSWSWCWRNSKAHHRAAQPAWNFLNVPHVLTDVTYPLAAATEQMGAHSPKIYPNKLSSTSGSLATEIN